MRFPLRVPPLPPPARSALTAASGYVRDALTPTLRLGVTGLSRAGKTVFITALVRNLIAGGRLPFFDAQAQGRILSAHLEPQPDDSIPRFDYEAHLEVLGRDPPEWPGSTRRISELRVVIGYAPENRIRKTLGISRLNVDIVDYPGEWLIDLGLLEQTYGQWSAVALEQARAPRRAEAAADWSAFVSTLDATLPGNEQIAIHGAALFTAYLEAAKTADRGVCALSPGRFLMPGDLAGSPLLTFFPLPLSPDATPAPGSLGAMMARRYESYKSHVVRPFFREHFSKLDRQIVLVDVLGALSSGPEALGDLEQALAGVLSAFKPGANSWLSRLLSRRVDRLLFAATKADHLNRTSHDRLEAILKLLTDRASTRASAAGADVKVMAIAALRATREAEVKDGKETLPCIIGVPMPGETIDGVTFDGRREQAIFPGDLPADPKRALDPALPQETSDAARFVRFRPTRLTAAGATGEAAPAPHIRLDRALDYLIGDWLS